MATDIDTATPHPTDSSWGRPVAPTRGRLRPLGLGDSFITGGFWADRQALNASVIIWHCRRWIEKMGWLGNFDAAIQGRLPQDRRGREFSDSEIYKVLEAMAWEIGRTKDEAIEAEYQSVLDRITPAQETDGYVNTNFGRPGQAARYSNLQWGHELYCHGHLIQAGIARARTHGLDDLVRMALRAADHVCRAFGPDGIQSVDGHPEIEPALAELTRMTGDPKYLSQAQLFLQRRGVGVLGDIEWGREYFQDDIPVRDAQVLRGHAVRALYLSAGALDVAVETDDLELANAVERQTRATLAKRTYITGGMGAHHEGESFGQDYELPSDRAYSETCAGVASVMLNHRLLMNTGDPVYADAVERALYNVVATSPSTDGMSFFYTNTLHQRVPGHPADPESASPRAASSLRAPWFDVSCCLPNVARLLASLGSYVATVDDQGVQLHQYVSGTVGAWTSGGRVAIEVRTNYPVTGRIEVTVLQCPEPSWTLTLRVPQWADGATVTVDGDTVPASSGSFEVHRHFAAGDTVVLDLPVDPRWTRPHPHIDALRGSIAVERGPVVLCMESVDLNASVNDVMVDTGQPPTDRDGRTIVSAALIQTAEPGWPYGGAAATTQHTTATQVQLIPYHQRANRGASTMRVWLPTLRS